ncbi:MAG TPA: T9SS type A sorting domain-containing protein [Flavobacteriales bacterium]|nr:T9SS type A sorting domain-containing protein [Flavobacteriales bacterium]
MRYILALFLLLTLNAKTQNFDWVWHAGGTTTSGYKEIVQVVTDKHGNSYSVGTCEDIMDLDPGPGVFLIAPPIGETVTFILKLDSAKNFLWAKRMPFLYYTGLALDPEDNLLITGYHVGFSLDVDPHPVTTEYLPDPVSCGMSYIPVIFVLKFDNAGNFVWSKGMPGVPDPALACGNVTTYGIVSDPLGNMYISGGIIGGIDYDPGVDTVYSACLSGAWTFILKFDSNGNFVWVKEIKGPGSITTTRIRYNQFSNHLLLGGYFQYKLDFDPGPVLMLEGSTDFLNVNMFILSLDTSGAFVDVKLFLDESNQWLTDLQADDNGNIYVACHGEDTVDVDPGPDTVLIAPVSPTDLLVFKLNATRDYEWAVRVGPIHATWWSRPHIDVDVNSVAYVATMYNFPFDTDPGPATDLTTGFGTLATCVLALDPFGGHNWMRSYDARFKVLEVDAFRNIYIGGTFFDTLDFDPGIGVHTVPGVYSGAYLLKLNQPPMVTVPVDDFESELENDSTAISLPGEVLAFHETENTNEKLRVYPNPTLGVVTIAVPSGTNALTITDVYARVVKTITPVGISSTIDLSTFANGVYFITVLNNGVKQTVKVIKS